MEAGLYIEADVFGDARCTAVGDGFVAVLDMDFQFVVLRPAVLAASPDGGEGVEGPSSAAGLEAMTLAVPDAVVGQLAQTTVLSATSRFIVAVAESRVYVLAINHRAGEVRLVANLEAPHGHVPSALAAAHVANACMVVVAIDYDQGVCWAAVDDSASAGGAHADGGNSSGGSSNSSAWSYMEVAPGPNASSGRVLRIFALGASSPACPCGFIVQTRSNDVAAVSVLRQQVGETTEASGGGGAWPPVRQLGVVFPGANLAGAALAGGRLVLAADNCRVKLFSSDAWGRVDHSIVITTAAHFPASGLVDELEDDGQGGSGIEPAALCVAAAAALTDGSSSMVVIATPLGIATLDAAAIAWAPVHYFDAVVSNAVIDTQSGLVACEYAMEGVGALVGITPGAFAAATVAVAGGGAAAGGPAPSLRDSVAALGNGIVLAAHDDLDTTAGSIDGDGDDGGGEATPDPLRVQSLLGGVPVPALWLAPLELKKPAAPAPGLTKPVTFGHKIKSAGYGTQTNEPWAVQQKRKLAAQKQQALLKKNGPPLPPPMPVYPLDVGPATVPLAKSNAVLEKTPVHAGAISGLAMDNAGQAIVTSSHDGTGHVLKLPVTAFKGDSAGWSLKGHTLPVLCCAAAYPAHAPKVHGNVEALTVATGSGDGTVRVWRPGRKAAAFITHGGLAGPAVKEVRAVRFLCQDKLLLAACGGNVSVLRFALDTGKSDLDRQKNDSRIVEVAKIASGAQTVTSLDAISFAPSGRFVYGASDRSIGVMDVGYATPSPVLRVADAHARPVHAVAAFSSSMHARLEMPVHHLVASAATDGQVRLWDLRATAASATNATPVRTITCHTNRSMPVGLALSPCGRYVAVGSEDRSVHLVDVGSGSAISRLPVPDVPGALAFNPAAPRLVVGTNNGHVRMFAAPGSA